MTAGPLAQRLVEFLGPHALRIDGHACGLQAEGSQGIDAAQETRILDGHLVTGDKVGAEQALDGIDRAMGQVDPAVRGAVGCHPAVEVRPQPGIDRRRPVEPRHVGPEPQGRGDIGQPVGVGIAAGQIDKGVSARAPSCSRDA
ncbi:hypothetical protein [Thauera humireducens]|uniref:hypothetical protein n=1 Tax=Thauera humireducens TaxID=1134435 RepID=UPI0031200FCA